jgi:hypothetical protein
VPEGQLNYFKVVPGLKAGPVHISHDTHDVMHRMTGNQPAPIGRGTGDVTRMMTSRHWTDALNHEAPHLMIRPRDETHWELRTFTLDEATMADPEDPQPKTKAERKALTTIPKKADKADKMEHRCVIPELPELPDLPVQVGINPRPAQTAAPAAAAGSTAQLILQQIRQAMTPQPNIVSMEDYEDTEEYPEDEEIWEPHLDSFLGDYENQPDLEYYQLEPQLLLAAQQAVEQAAKAAAEKAMETQDTTAKEVDEEDGHAGLLDTHIGQYADPQGEPLLERLATHVTNIWNKEREVQKIKEISARAPFPSNLHMRTPEVNAEVAPALGKFALLRDRKLKAVQALVVRTIVPVIKLADVAM